MTPRWEPTILGARLKIVDGRVTDTDHLVIHAGRQPLNPNMAKPRPGLVQPLEPSERIPREEMLKIANRYGPFDLPAAHVFKIRRGRIYEIEALDTWHRTASRAAGSDRGYWK